jgi:cyclopropane fatty-acyl-phospholipid synthase-like methyltransferase
MKEFWDERYAVQEYVYGKLPNEYLKQQLGRLIPGKILFPAEGEGRNAVYAARQGWEVFAFDQSVEGKRKALMLADEHGVGIDYRTGLLEEVDYAPGQFDAIVLIYAHFPPETKAAYHTRLAGYLRPGGTIIIETFSKLHTEYQEQNPCAGGPRNSGLLDSADELLSFYDGFEVLELSETETELNEGAFHRGKAHVVRFTGRKR